MDFVNDMKDGHKTASSEMEAISEEYLLEFVAMEAVQKVSKHGTAAPNGSIRIINSTKNGKRVELSKKVVVELDLADSTCLYIAKNANSFMICKEKFSEAASRYILRNSGSAKVVYCGALVTEISTLFDLDFTVKVCQTLDEIKYSRYRGYKMGFVTFNKKTSEEDTWDENSTEITKEIQEEY